jgi:hypothetical protein
MFWGQMDKLDETNSMLWNLLSVTPWSSWESHTP